jgi:hypothetical protein
MGTFTPRQRAWIALSELFRDTALQAFELDHTATELCELGLSAAEAETILWREVAPVFGPNLLATAGNWQGWSDESVVREINAYLATRGALTNRLGDALGFGLLRAAAYRKLVGDDWRQVGQRMERAAKPI